MPRIPRVLLLLTVTALSVTGCGGSSGSDDTDGPDSPDSPTPSPSPSSSSTPTSSSAAATSLTVEFRPDGVDVGDTYTLECDGPEPVGDSAAPDPAAACAALAAEGATLFAPPAADAVCTQIIAGLQTAHVSGTVNGQAVDAQFSLKNGCEISRWKNLTGLLGPAGGTL